MPEITHQTLEGLAAEYASALECRRALTGALRRRLLEVAEELAPALREATAAEADCRAALRDAVEGAPGLFARPRTRVVHGIKYGWQLGKASVEIPDEPKTIRLIRQHTDPAQQELLIVRTERVHKPSVLDLETSWLRKLAIGYRAAQDAVVCRPVADSVDQLVGALLAEAAREVSDA